MKIFPSRTKSQRGIPSTRVFLLDVGPRSALQKRQIELKTHFGVSEMESHHRSSAKSNDNWQNAYHTRGGFVEVCEVFGLMVAWWC